MITPLETVIRVLDGRFGVPAFSKVPSQRPDLFIRVDAGAPVMLSPVQDRTVIIVQVYGVDIEEVLETIGQIREFMRWDVYQLVDNVQWWDELSGPVEFPDPDVGSLFRWQLSGQLFSTLT